MTTVPLDLVLDRRVEPYPSRFFVQMNPFWWSQVSDTCRHWTTMIGGRGKVGP